MRDDILESNEPEHGLLGHPLSKAVGNAVELNQSLLLLNFCRLVPLKRCTSVGTYVAYRVPVPYLTILVKEDIEKKDKQTSENIYKRRPKKLSWLRNLDAGS
jgi:hypothetical protein